MKDSSKNIKKLNSLTEYGTFVVLGKNGVASYDDEDFASSGKNISHNLNQNKSVNSKAKNTNENEVRRKKINASQKVIDSEIKKNKKREQKITQKSIKHAQKKFKKSLAKRYESENRKKNRTEKVSKARHVSRFRTSIGAKLIFMISLVVILSLVSVTFIVSYFVSEDIRINAEENNLTINARTSADCSSRINSVVASIDMFMNLLSGNSDKNEQARNASMFFERYEDMIAIMLPDSEREYSSTKFLAIHEIDSDQLSYYKNSTQDLINGARSGEFYLKNASAFFRTPVIAIFSPIHGSKTDGCVLILYSSESLHESFSSLSVNQSFYVNLDGEILVHPDLAVMMRGDDWSENQVVQAMMQSNSDNAQMHFFTENDKSKEKNTDKVASKKASDKSGDDEKLVGDSGNALKEDKTAERIASDIGSKISATAIVVAQSVKNFFISFGELIKNFYAKIGFNMFSENEYVGAFSRLSDSNSAVITTVELSVILEGVRKTTYRNLYLTGAILALAIMTMWLYARSLSVPLKQLAKVADEINQANFNTPLFDELQTKKHDEVSVLVNSTKNEREILNTITKLTNIGVVKSVIRKEVDFEPHLKDITIFFSDIRGFTAISDGFNSRFGKSSGAAIIGFLNDYMSRMVQCIAITGGVVDKFEGDAIMACWGVLRNDSLDFEDLPPDDKKRASLEVAHEKHKIQDALSAIKATVAMRYSLRKYNKDAENFTKEHADEENAQYKPHIRIGSGLNSGRATVGFMGSWEKMEFTSIGDAVNLASRTESSNKPCGTDILITQDTYNLLKKDFIRCPENNFTISEENKENEVIVEKIPVEFEVKGKGKQHFYGVVNMPHFDIENFFRSADKDFVADEDCLDVVGEKGPKTLKALRILLGIPEPDFGGVNLDEEENKIQVSAG